MVKIAFCQATYDKDFEQTKECITRLSPYVDSVIMTYDQTLTDDQLKWLQYNADTYKIVSVYHKFEDNLPEMRNSYVKKAKELGMDWICVSDPDELYSEELARGLRSIIEKHGEIEGYNMLAVSVRDQFDAIEWLDELDRLKECPGGYRETDYWKPLLILKLQPDLVYKGVGKKENVHETVYSKIPFNSMNLDKKYFYVHKKSALKIWRNAARNMFIGGGGDNVGEVNPLWVKLRDICGKLGIENWGQFEEFIVKGMGQWLLDKELYKEYNIDKESIDKFNGWKTKFDEYGDDKYKNPSYWDIGENVDPVMRLQMEKHKYDFFNWQIEKVKIENSTEYDKYKQYIKYLERSDELKCYIQKFESWLILALQAGTNNWQTETRETAKWYFALHKEEVDDFIVALINRQPLANQDAMIDAFVVRTYFQILGRPPDEYGKTIYTKAIKEKIITPDKLADIFRESEEYKRKFGTPIKVKLRTGTSSGKDITISLPPSLAGKFGSVDLRDTSKYNTVGLCIMGFAKNNGMDMITESIRTMAKVVNEIHVQGDDFGEKEMQKFRELGKEIGKDICVWNEPWKDDFGDYKNKAISHATTEWVMITDHDEIPTQEIVDSLKDIILKSDRGSNFDMISFDVIDIRTTKDVITGKEVVIRENRSDSGKPLLHWNIPNPYHGTLHIWLKPGYYPWRQAHVSAAYKHVKNTDSELERSVRNVFLGGGGDAVKHQNLLWVELQQVSKELGIRSWEQFNSYLKKSKIDDRIYEILVRLGEMPWKDAELQDPLKYYWKLHPEERARKVVNLESMNLEEEKRSDEIKLKILEPENDEIKKLYDMAKPAATTEMVLADKIEHDWEKYYKLKPGNVFVEIGAFWGRYGLVAQKLVGKNGKVILIEASPVNVTTLKDLVNNRLLDKENVIIVPRAIGDKKELVKFYNRGNPASHGLMPSEKRGLDIGGDLIEIDTLDNVLDSLGIEDVDLLGCDCEDCEIKMLLGAGKRLSSGRMKNVAIATYHSEGNHEKASEILKRHGFKDIILDDTITYGHI